MPTDGVCEADPHAVARCVCCLSIRPVAVSIGLSMSATGLSTMLCLPFHWTRHGIEWCRGGTLGIQWVGRVKETRVSNGVEGAHMGSKKGR